MGIKALTVIFAVFTLSLLIMDTTVLPSWISANKSLYQLTFVLWLIGISFAIVKFGLEI